MKFATAVVAVFAATFGVNAESNSPVTKVVTLLNELKASIEADGKKEQQSFDKASCWCEQTLDRKAKDISDAKTKIKETQVLIVKLSAEVAVHGAEIKQLEKDIAANEKAQKDATEVRSKGNAEYMNERTESEQAIGAMEAAIKVLSGAGTGKGEFLEKGTMREAEMLSVAASIRPVLSQDFAQQTLSDQDMQIVKSFVYQPESFGRAGSKSGAFGALQVDQNPFGDYAPQSTQISGILKGLYDAFGQSLEKANAEEAEAQKAFEEFMVTKQAELTTLQATLAKHQMDFAEKTKLLAESKQLRDDTVVQLEADETFFEDTKLSCRDRATSWSVRSGLRTEELQGLAKGIEILSSPAAQATFQNATTTFLQVAEGVLAERTKRVAKTFASHLRALATRHPQAAGAFLNMATDLESTGHFDKVISSIDKMIEVLRVEGQDDIKHRDRCQGDQNKNKNDMEDLSHAVEKASSEISRMDDKAADLSKDVSTLEEEIAATNADIEEALKMRNKEVKEYRQALKDDTEAIKLLDAAIVALNEFYKRNQIELVQKKEEPEYTIDEDKMPSAAWEDEPYEGRQETSAPVISMISAIKEDLENEVNTSKVDEVAAQASYEKERAAMRESLKAQTESKVATEKQLAELQGKIQDTENHKAAKQTDLTEQQDVASTLTSDCAWVETHFNSRKEARKSEIDGLTEAKGYLAGMETGDAV